MELLRHRLKNERKRLKLTQSQLAALVDKSMGQSFISNLETGERPPTRRRRVYNTLFFHFVRSFVGRMTMTGWPAASARPDKLRHIESPPGGFLRPSLAAE